MSRRAVVLVWKVLLLVVVATSAVAAGFGGWLAVDDLSSRGDMFDGLGAFVGLLFVAAAAIAGVPSLVAVLAHGRYPRACEVVALLVGLTLTGLALVPLIDGPTLQALVPTALGAALSLASVRLLSRPTAESWTWANG